MIHDESFDLSNFISVNVISGKPFVLTHYSFIENILRIGWGPRAHDERLAFEWIGGLGFAARRKRRRLFLWGIAEGIAERVGHGEEQEPMRVVPNQILVPISAVEEVERLFGSRSRL